ncbi:MAG: hypothetical protein WBA07_34820, partial [Rivularia sp. (in: cyanobacteria)]
MQSLHRVNTGDLQRFLDAPEELLGESEEMQIAIATFPETPRSLLEVLINSDYSEVAEAARLHINWVGEVREDYQKVVSEILRDKDLGENDRLAVELMRFAPVPPEFLSEWVPVNKLIQGLKNEYMPLRYRLQLLERLAQEGELEARLQVAESSETPVSLLELLAGDLNLAVRLAVEYNDNSPLEVVELVKIQHDLASDWDADVKQLMELGESHWGWVRLAVAQNPYTPVQTLKLLSEDGLPKIQLEVAKNPKTQKWILEELSKHQNINKYPEIGVYIQAAIAEHPNMTGEAENKNIPFLGRHKLRLNKEETSETSQARGLMGKRINSPYALAQVVEKGDRNSKITAARNLKTPVSILEQLAKDTDETVRSALVQNPNLSSNCLIELAENSTFNVQLTIARRTHPIPVEVLLQFSLHENKMIRSEIAQNKNTPSDILAFLAEDKQRDVRIYALANANIPSEVVFQALLNTKDNEELEIVLQAQNDMMRNSLMSPEILERLSYHPEDLIRHTVATYPTASAKTLERLALHEYEIIPEAVAKNPSTPASILIELAKRDYYVTEIERYHTISYQIAIRKDAPPEALEYIVRQPIVPLVLRALENTNTPVNALEWLLDNQDNESILGLVAKHSNTTPYILIRLSANQFVKVRQAVASQQQCSLEILETLAQDSAIEVREKETKKILGTLELLLESCPCINIPGHEDGGYIYPFVWETSKQGDFNALNLSLSKGWLKLTKNDAIRTSSQAIEYAKSFNNFSINEDEEEQRLEKIIALFRLLDNNLQELETFETHSYYYAEGSINLIIARTIDGDLISVCPTAYIETYISQEQISRTLQEQKHNFDKFGENTKSLILEIEAITSELETINISGDFGEGYTYDYAHSVVYT